jgi:hypothetical protein
VFHLDFESLEFIFQSFKIFFQSLEIYFESFKNEKEGKTIGLCQGSDCLNLRS